MSRYTSDENPDIEPPLDPAAERLQRKLKRLLLISSLVMVLGFVAVFAAIIYRVTARDVQADLPAIAAIVAVGENARVIDIEVLENRIAVLVDSGTGASLIYVDPTTGRELGRTNFVSE